MAEIVNKYPVGIQTFDVIREEGYLYGIRRNTSQISGRKE